ncbi:unnamed protein product [Ceratitis capitata]|uniref:(Mediterranean fruit fly) hypothetical protein n=2 Tax=Ceratitis capitata TaxID=7213 RepID=A0A811UMJ0_CERCA|nr:unnamed protein product [Ceratitis capitata]
MPSGPPVIGVNRFALLAESSKINKKKKKKSSFNKSIDLFPELPTVQKSNPKFVVLESSDKTKPLSHYSCFAVQRSIHLISKEIQSISELRDGSILLLVNNKNVAEKFLALKELYGICPIKAKYHDNLNFNKGTVYAPFLNNVSEKEIVSELCSQGVVAVYKFLKNINGKMQPSGVILLTFDLYHIPEKLDIAWRNVRVRQYIPTPMRCKNCQLLGHTAKFCKRAPVCDNCSLPPHLPDICSRILCANCASNHPSSSNKCEKFIQAKEILKIKVTRKCTMREAINIHKNSVPTLPESSASFSSVIKLPNINQQTTEICSMHETNSNSSLGSQNISNQKLSNSPQSALSSNSTSNNESYPLNSQPNTTLNINSNNTPTQTYEKTNDHSQNQYLQNSTAPPGNIQNPDYSSPLLYNAIINSSSNLSNIDENFQINFDAYNNTLRNSTDMGMISEDD